MKKRLLTILAAAAVLALVVPDAEAQRYRNSGYCPAGTCANNGGVRANNVRNCSARNCQSGYDAKAQGTLPTKARKK